ncbi:MULTISPECIES: cupin domain-containing protein [Natrialbaceae]|uniref:cupin domain-containing protein n=1 Tax=Natrialbaceae TaxID=1644061 RepID=UPI00207D3869|nr:cupin domain-containing protein [Natronococcus sp. CG52]
MGYHLISPDDIDPLSDRPVDARSVSDAAGLENVGLRLYEASPGEQLPLAYHYHEQQEEAFYVTEGVLHVETPDEEYVVEAGNVFVAEPSSPHRAYNPTSASGPVRVLAVGAPAVSDAEPYESS